jgi:hypothetical protein
LLIDDRPITKRPVLIVQAFLLSEKLIHYSPINSTAGGKYICCRPYNGYHPKKRAMSLLKKIESVSNRPTPSLSLKALRTANLGEGISCQKNGKHSAGRLENVRLVKVKKLWTLLESNSLKTCWERLTKVVALLTVY